MIDQVEEDEQSFRLETYVVAGFYFAIVQMPAEDVRTWNRQEELKRVFFELYSVSLSEDVLNAAIDLMDDLRLLNVDDDKYAGRFISLQKTAFISQFKQLGDHLSKSPLGIVLRAGPAWLRSVYEKQDFWRELEDSISGLEDGSMTSEPDIPAADRYVTLLHNSPERIEAENSFSALFNILKTNNEIAVDLGDDRERITAEVDAGLSGIKSEKIRVGFIKEHIIRILREILSKLKDKAIEIGVDRLIVLFEKIVENFY